MSKKSSTVRGIDVVQKGISREMLKLLPLGTLVPFSLWEMKQLTYSLCALASPRKEGGDKQKIYHT